MWDGVRGGRQFALGEKMNRPQVLWLVLALLLFTGIARADDSVASLGQYLASDATKRAALDEQPFAKSSLTRAEADAARRLLWADHVRQIKQTRAAEVQAKRIVEGKLEMPFDYRVFGDKPTSGRSLFISMHGGGNAPKATNDQQWANQKRLYTPAEGEIGR